MKKMTKQEVFDKVVRHCLTQGKASFDMREGEAVCRYRSRDEETGSKLACAAGCLIPDAVYAQIGGIIETKSVGAVEVWPHFSNAGVPDEARWVLAYLQSAHDAASPVMHTGESLTTPDFRAEFINYIENHKEVFRDVNTAALYEKYV